MVAGQDFSLKRSADATRVIEVTVSALSCSGIHSFTVAVSIPISGSRFSADDIPVPGGTQPRSLDIDGVFFDGDGDGTGEQALGGLSFAAGSSRCNERWWATASTSDDRDGWNDAGERRLGSSPGSSVSIPEHAVVPTTARATPGPCADSLDNDGDGQMDAAEPDGPDPDTLPDCA